MNFLIFLHTIYLVEFYIFALLCISSVLSQHNNDVKMQDLERFEHQVEDMYNILLNISSELLTIKSLMKANRSKLNENDNKTEGKKYLQMLDST